MLIINYSYFTIRLYLLSVKLSNTSFLTLAWRARRLSFLLFFLAIFVTPIDNTMVTIIGRPSGEWGINVTDIKTANIRFDGKRKTPRRSLFKAHRRSEDRNQIRAQTRKTGMNIPYKKEGTATNRNPVKVRPVTRSRITSGNDTPCRLNRWSQAWL